MTRLTAPASAVVGGCLLALALGSCRQATADAPHASAGDAAAPAVGCELTLDGRHEGGHLVTLVNGFPVDRGSGVSRYRAYRVGASVSLVSGANTLVVRMTPLLGRSGRALVVGRPALTAALDCAGGGGVTLSEGDLEGAHERWRAGLLERWDGWLAAEDSVLAARPDLAAALADSLARGPGSVGLGPALDSARAWARAHPAEAEGSFEYAVAPGRASGGAPSFDAVFREAPVIGGTPADSARLRAYAVRLRDLTAARDTAALAEAFRPALMAKYLVWGGEDALGQGVEVYLAGLREQLVVSPLTPFEADDVELRSWAGGRVWELLRTDGEPLLNGLSVYTGEADGQLRVVRVSP